MVTKSSDGNFGLGGNRLNGMGGIPRLYFLRDTFHYDDLVPFLGAVASRNTVNIATFLHDGQETASAFVNGVTKATQSGEPTMKAAAVKGFSGGHLACRCGHRTRTTPATSPRSLSTTEC